jgi:hypothetical protein
MTLINLFFFSLMLGSALWIALLFAGAKFLPQQWPLLDLPPDVYLPFKVLGLFPWSSILIALLLFVWTLVIMRTKSFPKEVRIVHSALSVLTLVAVVVLTYATFPRIGPLFEF